MSDEREARVVLDRDGAVATITLARDERLNAFDRRQHEALAEAFAQVEADPDVRAVILTGRGRAFSAGQDLQERAATFAAGSTPDIRASLDELYNPLMRRIAALPVPVIAAVQGAAFGAGAALAIGCDITLAAPSATFQFGFLRVGLGPDSGASWLLPRLVGMQRALDLVLSGHPIGGVEAASIGLVARCVPADELLPQAAELAHQIAAGPRNAIRTTKALLRAGAKCSFDQALDAERDAQAELGATPEYRDAVVRFAARSAPDPKGSIT